MKVLFSADYHLKLGTKNIPDTWAINRYRMLFSLINEFDEVDLHIIGGDLFDRLPSIQELELYFEFVVGIKVKTIIIPGNHEAKGKYSTFLTNLVEVTQKLNPLVEIVDDYYVLENIDFIPYNRLKQYNGTPSFNGDILVSHFRGEIPPHVKPEVDLSMFEQWKIVLAGDLHSHSNSQLNILYPGSPVTTSFHRSEVDTGVIIIDTETLQWEWVKLKVPQLIRKSINVGDPMPATEFNHTIYEVTGDLSNLHLVENSDLVDKKVTKRVDDTALILTDNMTVSEELKEYLLYILGLEDKIVDDVIKEFNDNIAKYELE
jgi:DNA repair exonuclease SbcCD nuclease subunit